MLFLLEKRENKDVWSILYRWELSLGFFLNSNVFSFLNNHSHALLYKEGILGIYLRSNLAFSAMNPCHYNY